MSNKLKKITDQVLATSLLKLIPGWLSPNFFSVLRLVLIPFVVLFIVLNWFGLSLSLFILAAVSDSIDGALARTRHQISDKGVLMDPVADKLLIILTILFLMLYYPEPVLFIAIIVINIILGLGAFISLVIKGQAPTSNVVGNLKMMLESLGIVCVFIFLAFPTIYTYWLSVAVLITALLLGMLSILVYTYRHVME